MMTNFAKSLLSRARDYLSARQVDLLQLQHDVALRAVWTQSLASATNPLNKFGAKYFSQADEDGITLEVVRRLGVVNGTFAELGVGDGLENNTLILLASGWRGCWIGGQDLAFNPNINPARLVFIKSWISLENIVASLRTGFARIAASNVDVVSLDLDGNDYYFVREILKAGILPKLFIVEYNAKFPPPIKWTIKYDGDHHWDGTDYYGASIALFSELFAKYSYTLVCCNAVTGVNAFFVQNEYLPRFADVPKKTEDIFVGATYQLFERWGSAPSLKTIEQMLSTNSQTE